MAEVKVRNMKNGDEIFKDKDPLDKVDRGSEEEALEEKDDGDCTELVMDPHMKNPLQHK